MTSGRKTRRREGLQLKMEGGMEGGREERSENMKQRNMERMREEN